MLAINSWIQTIWVKIELNVIGNQFNTIINSEKAVANYVPIYSTKWSQKKLLSLYSSFAFKTGLIWALLLLFFNSDGIYLSSRNRQCSGTDC